MSYTIIVAICTLALFIIILPIVLLFLIILFLTRWIISKFYKFRLTNSRILDYHSSVIYEERNPTATVYVKLIVHGLFDFQAFKDRIILCLNKRHDNGCLVYPELQQRVEILCGYPFWTDDLEFNINNHIQIQSDINGNTNETNCNGDNHISNSMQHEEFSESHSPWKIYLTPETTNKSTILVLKFAHYLADGESMFRFITDCADKPEAVKCYQPKSYGAKEVWLNCIKTPLSFIISSIKQRKLIKKASILANGCSMRCKAPASAWNFKPFNFSESNRCINVDKIKKISKTLNVSFTAVLLATIQFGITEFLSKQENICPDFVQAIIPFPAPKLNKSGGPNRFGNNFYIIRDCLETNYKEAIQEQIKCMDQQLCNIKTSAHFIWNGIITNCFGLLPLPLIRMVLNISKCSYICDICYSIFPGPISIVNLCGQPVKEMYFYRQLSFATRKLK